MIVINIISFIGIIFGIISVIAGIVALARHKEKKYQEMYHEYLQQKLNVEEHLLKTKKRMEK
ncbi:MAG: hypothetical protein J1F01_02470 [Oscillospiraceae bacterium]|nr:hypothetical protein [Oscillospiraceae bacterium]